MGLRQHRESTRNEKRDIFSARPIPRRFVDPEVDAQKQRLVRPVFGRKRPGKLREAGSGNRQDDRGHATTSEANPYDVAQDPEGKHLEPDVAGSVAAIWKFNQKDSTFPRCFPNHRRQRTRQR